MIHVASQYAEKPRIAYILIDCRIVKQAICKFVHNAASNVDNDAKLAIQYAGFALASAEFLLHCSSAF